MPKIRATSPLEVSESWIKRKPCPPDEDGAPRVSHWIWAAALAFKLRNLPEDVAFDLIQRSIPPTRATDPKEIWKDIKKAYGSTGNFGGSAVSKAQKPKYDPELLARYASRVPFEVTDDWLAEVSPECVLGVTPSEFLSMLYEPEECVAIVVGENHPDGKPKWRKLETVWAHGDGAGSLDFLTSSHPHQKAGIWFNSNPVKADATSWSEPNIASWRFAVLESDQAPSDLWLRLLVQLNLPIAAIYTSGKRSIHALIRVDAAAKDEWDSWAKKGDVTLASKLVPFGADPDCLTAVRLTRLPGCFRGESGQVQKLLYLNPEPQQKPIYATTTR